MQLVATTIGLVLSVSLALTVFANAMRAEKEDLLFLLYKKRLLLISLLSVLVMAPVVAITVY